MKVLKEKILHKTKINSAMPFFFFVAANFSFNRKQIELPKKKIILCKTENESNKPTTNRMNNHEYIYLVEFANS